MTNHLWQPTASIAHLRQRAKIIKKIRSFFENRGYLEVETPALAKHGITDVYLQNIKAYFRHQPYYLQTSPEYHMKRLLAAGSGPIFQLAHVFRDDELGRFHNPEFSLLEWYQLDVDHWYLMNEVDELLQQILNCGAAIKISYQEIFQQVCQIDPFSASLHDYYELLEIHQLADVLQKKETDIDQFLFLIMSHIIEPALAQSSVPVAIYDFPASQAALAQVKNQRAERFEFYYRGVELANGFHELTDYQLQKERFIKDCRQREQFNLEIPVIDKYFLAALEEGLPYCSGVALGVDRLIMLALEVNTIEEIQSFSFRNA